MGKVIILKCWNYEKLKMSEPERVRILQYRKMSEYEDVKMENIAILTNINLFSTILDPVSWHSRVYLPTQTKIYANTKVKVEIMKCHA